ncbi:MAG: class I SAM-dependent methyltransferase [Thioalkalispiraceae bacterium]|jgi:hypothetical protein
MSVTFKDHFSGHAEDYGKYRPSYPDALFKYLPQICRQHNRAWDCATGNGQSAVALAKYFQHVIASDASENQLRHAAPAKNVNYIVAPAEQSGIASHTVDLITVAQALHWFDLEAFTIEVDRVLVDQGVLAVWTYNLLTINPEIDAVIDRLYSDLLDAYWPDERSIVETGYRHIQFPLTKLDAPRFEMITQWNLPQLAGYLNTWSAVKRFENDHNSNPVEMIWPDLAAAWGDEQVTYTQHWPLALRLWRKS